MTTDSLMTWFSMTKAVTAVARRAAVGTGRARPRRHRRAPPSRVRRRAARTRVTIRHLPHAHRGLGRRRRDRSTARPGASRAPTTWRASTRPRPTYEPGTPCRLPPRGGHEPCSARSSTRVSGVPFDRYVRDEIFGPLGMDDCWVGMPARALRGVRRPHRLDAPRRHGDPPRRSPASTRAACAARAEARRERARADEPTRSVLRDVRRPRAQRDGVRVLDAVDRRGDLGPPPHGHGRRDVRRRHRLGPRSRRRLLRDGPALRRARAFGHGGHAVVGRVL